MPRNYLPYIAAVPARCPICEQPLEIYKDADDGTVECYCPDHAVELGAEVPADLVPAGVLIAG